MTPLDGSLIGPDATTGSTSGTGGSSGDGIGTGTGAMSGGGSGVGGPASGSGGTSRDGGPPAPPPLKNGEVCTDDARCASGHCDNVCCDKGSECCRNVNDCTTQGGLGMSCDDRSTCRGSAGKITCTDEFKCVTLDGARNDSACTNRVEANDCGLYPSVFCLGGELQQGAPSCETSCAADSQCDLGAHCSEGKCEQNKPNGERCTRPEDCAAGFCKNIANGSGVCCGLMGDCCSGPDDCPAMYRKAPQCDDPGSCKGTETVAECIANICSMNTVPANQACNGMPGPTCGAYQDITCMVGRSSNCRTSCTSTAQGQCDANAYCDARSSCQLKKPTGQTCAMANECESGNCGNGICCGAGRECCKQVDDCKASLDAQCDVDNENCQGSRRSAMCQSSQCVYGTDRVDDDRACNGPRSCGAFDDKMCTGGPDQTACKIVCMNTEECDSNASCVAVQGQMRCQVGGGGNAGMSGSGGSGGNRGPGGGND